MHKDGMLALAGICDWWLDPSKKPDDPSKLSLSFSILTKGAAKPLDQIHERISMILLESTIAEWLDTENLEDPENTTQVLLCELSEESDQLAAHVKFWRVSPEVSNARNNSLELIERK